MSEEASLTSEASSNDDDDDGGPMLLPNGMPLRLRRWSSPSPLLEIGSERRPWLRVSILSRVVDQNVIRPMSEMEGGRQYSQSQIRYTWGKLGSS
jgi:hypothetical protein